MSLKIIGTGAGIPKKSISNDDLALFLDTDDEWITSRTGIKSRFICTDETLTNLSEQAAAQAIEKAGLTPEEIGLIICSTIGSDHRTPSLACCVAQRINAKCPAFDINAACSGFLYALEIASLYLNADKTKNILIICAEMMSKHVDWNDRSTCVLFGDGAAACVVTGGTALKYIHLVAKGDVQTLNLPSGTGNSPFIINKKEYAFLHMEGQEVFKFAIGMVERELQRALAALHLLPEDIDFFLLHQANKRIIDSARTRLKQPKEKFPTNIATYGNISSASIPLLLHEMLGEGKIKSGDILFLSAFGAGMTAGSCIMIWE